MWGGCLEACLPLGSSRREPYCLWAGIEGEGAMTMLAGFAVFAFTVGHVALGAQGLLYSLLLIGSSEGG